MQRGMQTLTDRMSQSIDGTGKGAEAFDRLNLSAQNLDGTMKNQDQMFEETAKALMGLPEGAEKSQLAFELFGKAGQELMPMLNGTAEDMDALKDKAHELGFVMDEESVKTSAAFKDSMDDIKKAMGGAIAKIGVELMPMFQSMMDWVMAHMPEIQAVIKKVFEVVADVVKVAIDIFTNYLLPIFAAVYNWTKENWPTIQKIIEGVFKAIGFVWDNVLAPVLGFLWDALKLVVDFVANNFDGMQRTVESVMDGIGAAVKIVTGIFDGVVGAIKTAYDWLTKWNDKEVKEKNTQNPDTSSNPRNYVTRPQRNAKGTENFNGDWTWIGEEGPELMQLPKGTKIRSNEKSMAMANSTMNHTGTITVKGVNDKNELNSVVDIVMEQLRREVRMA